jgi:hypothetical protein
MLHCRYAVLALLGSIMPFAISISAAVAASAPKPLAGECPGEYRVNPGLNVDFPIDGTKRAFVVVPPADLATPVPVWVPAGACNGPGVDGWNWAIAANWGASPIIISNPVYRPVSGQSVSLTRIKS